MAHLLFAHFVFEANHLRAVFAELAVHVGAAELDFGDALVHGPQQQLVAAEGAGVQVFFRRSGAVGFHLAVDALEQHAGKQKHGQHHHPPVGQVFEQRQRILQQRLGDADKGRGGKAEAQTFPEQAGELGHFRVSVGVIGTAPHHQQAAFLTGHRGVGGFGLRHHLPGELQQRGRDAQVPAQGDFQVRVLLLERVHLERNIVLGVPAGKEDGRNGRDLAHALLVHALHGRRVHRVGKLQKAVVDDPVGVARNQARHQLLEAGRAFLVAAAVATNQNALFA